MRDALLNMLPPTLFFEGMLILENVIDNRVASLSPMLPSRLVPAIMYLPLLFLYFSVYVDNSSIDISVKLFASFIRRGAYPFP